MSDQADPKDQDQDQAEAEALRRKQRLIDQAETQAMCEAEGTPLRLPTGPRLGRPCPECGYPEGAGHRMDCCFF